jgi:hypothetical protein
MLLFLDGQAHYDTSRVPLKYSTVDTSNATWSVTAEGRLGNCLKRVATTAFSTTQGYLAVAPLMTRLGPWTPTASGVCGFAIKVDDLGKLDNNIQMKNHCFRVVEGGNYHLRVNLNTDGTFSLIRNMGSTSEGSGGPTILAQSIEGLTEGAWSFVEFKWVIHPTAGLFEIRVNGVQVLHYTNDTNTGGILHSTQELDPFFNSLGIWNAVELMALVTLPTAPYLTLRLCDIYLADLTAPLGDDVHDFLGDGSVLTIYPNAPGDATGWTPSSAPNWDAVNDKPLPDDDATYVATATLGVTDLYQFEDIPAGAIVKGAQLSILARKETAGGASLAPLLQPPGSGPLTGPAQGVASTLYTGYLSQPYDLNPVTGVRFTATDINTGQFGVTKTV